MERRSVRNDVSARMNLPLPATRERPWRVQETVMGQVRKKLGEIGAVSLVTLVPLVMWLGFAENVEVPKMIVLEALALALVALALADRDRRRRLARSPLTLPLICLVASGLASCALSGAAVVSQLSRNPPTVSLDGSTCVPASMADSLARSAFSASLRVPRIVA